jgi:hypothetical protein
MTSSIASLRQRIERGPRRSRPVMLAKGLAVCGETPANAREIHRQPSTTTSAPTSSCAPA